MQKQLTYMLQATVQGDGGPAHGELSTCCSVLLLRPRICQGGSMG